MRHLRGSRASSDPGTTHAQEPAGSGMAEPMRHETGTEGLSWDEMKRDTGVEACRSGLILPTDVGAGAQPALDGGGVGDSREG